MDNRAKPPSYTQIHRRFLLPFCVLGFGFTLLFGFLVFRNPYWIFLFPIWTALMRLLFSPLLAVLGITKYYSPMLLVLFPKKSYSTIHSGTSFDTLMLIGKYGIGKRFRLQNRLFYWRGFETIIDAIERGDLLDRRLFYGTSYVINKKSAQQIGFTVSPPKVLQVILIVVFYFDLLWTYSLAQGRITFPRLRDLCEVSAAGRDLVSAKAFYTQQIRSIKKQLS